MNPPMSNTIGNRLHASSTHRSLGRRSFGHLRRRRGPGDGCAGDGGAGRDGGGGATVGIDGPGDGGAGVATSDGDET